MILFLADIQETVWTCNLLASLIKEANKLCVLIEHGIYRRIWLLLSFSPSLGVNWHLPAGISPFSQACPPLSVLRHFLPANAVKERAEMGASFLVSPLYSCKVLKSQEESRVGSTTTFLQHSR